MLTFSVNRVGSDYAYQARVVATINSLYRYFVKYNRYNTDEAMQRVYQEALDKQNDSFDNLFPFIKKLARVCMRRDSKVTKNEILQPVCDDEGRDNPNFVTEALEADVSLFQSDNARALNIAFTDMYLENPEDFLRLKDNIVNSVPDSVHINKTLKTKMIRLQRQYDNRLFWLCLCKFFKGLDASMDLLLTENDIKEIRIKSVSSDIIPELVTEPHIVTEAGDLCALNPYTLHVDGVNMDFDNWESLLSPNKDILRVDISAFMDYMYASIIVPEGYNTPYISWLNGRYRVTSPGGQSMVNSDRTEFIEQTIVRELVSNLIANNVSLFIGVTQDYYYFVPRKRWKYKKIKLMLGEEKVIYLPVEYVEVRRRKRKNDVLLQDVLSV